MKEKSRRGCVVALGLLMAAAAWAQTKVVVMSDIHVMAKELVVNDSPAWQKKVAKDRKLFEYSREVLDVMTEQLLQEKPDLILVSGDLTKDGEMLSHQYVVRQLDKLRAAGIRTYVIPGNHDLGTSQSKIFDGETTRQAEVADSRAFASLYAHYGYGEGSERDPESLSYCCEPVEGLVLIGIDSGSNGQLKGTTLQWLTARAQKATKAGKRVVAMMHHALVPHFNSVDKLMPGSVVGNYETVRDRLSDAGVQVVLTGHFHVSDIARDFTSDLSRSIYDVATGSTITYPCDYRRLTFSSDFSELQITTDHITTLPSQPEYKAIARERLFNGAAALVGSRLKNNTLCMMVAGAMIVHAEGNEDQSEEAADFVNTYKFGKSMLKSNTSLLDKLAQQGLSLDLLENILMSIMTDRTSYGIEGREDKTDDLQLNIKFF